MKTRPQIFTMAIIALVAVAGIIACGGDDPTPTPETFTVTFNANGGSPTPPVQTVEKGATVTEPTGAQAPTKANNTLDGWYKEAALTTKWNFASDKVTANITLWAKWVSDGLCHCEEGTTHEPDENCCEGTDCTCKIAQPFTIGGNNTTVNITLEYHKIDNTSVEKIQSVVDWFNLRFGEDSAAHQDTITNLLNGGGGYKIIVDYSNTFDGFVAANAQTIKVSKAWLDTNPTFNGNTLRNALNAMLAKPAHETTQPFTLGTAECAVTIISNDTFTAAEWETLCEKVVTAIMRGYNKYTDVGGFDDFSNKDYFENVFASTANAKIILSSSATHDCEVKNGEWSSLYLKISAIDTVDLEYAVACMGNKFGKYPE